MALPSHDEVVQRANQQSHRLRALIQAPEILVMPGAYDTLSALLFESMGFKAIQGTSGGIAAVFGLQDGEILRREEMVGVYRRMVQAVNVPVNADGEKGYGGPTEVADTVRQLVLAGAAGMNLEDGDYRKAGEPARLLPLDSQLNKIGALMETKRDLDSEFFLNARVDAFLTDVDPKLALEEAVQRGNAYAEAGADCIFYIRANGVDTISTLVREVKAPVSILANASSPSIKELEDMGVARVSYGAAFARVALAGVKGLGDVVLAKGNPASLLTEATQAVDWSGLLRNHLPE